MADDQRTVGGRSGRGRQADGPPAGGGAEPGATQVSGTDYSASRTVPVEGGPPLPPQRMPGAKGASGSVWSAPSPGSSAFVRTPFAPPSTEQPEEVGGETVVMEMEPKAQIPLAWLAIVEGPGGKRGKVVTLGMETVIGRKIGELTLNADHGVSTQHVKVRLEPKGEPANQRMANSEGGEQVFVLYDLASTNGTYVGTRDGVREEGSRIYRRELKDGDFVLVGETLLVFKQVEDLG